MKKTLVLLLSFCFVASMAFAQQTEERELTEEEKKELKEAMEELKVNMDQLKIDLKETFKDLKVEMDNLEIDLSGLEALKDIDWEDYVDEEDMKYLKSQEFKDEMAKVKIEIREAMEEARKEIENVDWDKINKSIQDAMKEVEIEMSKVKEKKKQQ